MDKLCISLLVAFGALAASPVQAKQTYASYEGADAVQVGTGGTKLAKNGIDYWTTGSPPRRFQVLGIITDARKNRAFDGDVLGSKSIAKLATKAGGDAVIMGTGDIRNVGTVSSFNANAYGNSAWGTGFRRTITRTTTQIIVIRYLPEQ